MSQLTFEITCLSKSRIGKCKYTRNFIHIYIHTYIKRMCILTHTYVNINRLIEKVAEKRMQSPSLPSSKISRASSKLPLLSRGYYTYIHTYIHTYKRNNYYVVYIQYICFYLQVNMYYICVCNVCMHA